MTSRLGFIISFVVFAIIILFGFGMVLLGNGLPQFLGVLLMFVPIVVAIVQDIRKPSRL